MNWCDRPMNQANDFTGVVLGQEINMPLTFNNYPLTHAHTDVTTTHYKVGK